MTETSKNNPEPESGISLHQLAEAFAEVMGSDTASTDSPVENIQAEEEVWEGDQSTSPEGEGDHCPINPRTIFEAMIFVGNQVNEPLSARRAAELMRDVDARDIASLVDELIRLYTDEKCPYTITNEGAGYRLVLNKQFESLRNRFLGGVREARLSQAAIDTLAIIAYQQPLTGEQVGQLRGKPSRHVLTQLVRRGLLRIEREEGKPRVTRYFTTDRFLELFGLEGLEDLPKSEELDH